MEGYNPVHNKEGEVIFSVKGFKVLKPESVFKEVVVNPITRTVNDGTSRRVMLVIRNYRSLSQHRLLVIQSTAILCDTVSHLLMYS